MEILLDSDLFSLVKPILLGTKRFKESYITEYDLDPKLFQETKEKILRSYDEEREKSCELGTRIHAEIENSFYTGEDKVLQKYGIGGTLPVYKGDYSLDFKQGVYPEFLVSYRIGDFLLCGQIDLLCVFNDQITIIDHKTCKKIEMKSFYDRVAKKSKMMKFPLNNIMDCNGQHYALQLSTYA